MYQLICDRDGITNQLEMSDVYKSNHEAENTPKFKHEKLIIISFVIKV